MKNLNDKARHLDNILKYSKQSWRRDQAKQQLSDIELFYRAKAGEPESVKHMTDQQAYIWTQEQLDALNYYLGLEHPLPKTNRYDVATSMQLQRGVLPEQVEPAQALWSQHIGEGYYLTRYMFEDGALVDWLLTYDKDMKLKLLCNVSSWHNPNQEGGLND